MAPPRLVEATAQDLVLAVQEQQLRVGTFAAPRGGDLSDQIGRIERAGPAIDADREVALQAVPWPDQAAEQRDRQLSTASNPRSSSAFSAVVRPAPDIPVTRTIWPKAGSLDPLRRERQPDLGAGRGRTRVELEIGQRDAEQLVGGALRQPRRRAPPSATTSRAGSTRNGRRA